MNIVEPILHQCRWQPLALALCAPGSPFNAITYGQLGRFIQNVHSKARQHGIGRGNVVALSIKDPILHSIAILGLASLGVVTVSARDLKLPAELKVDTVLVDSVEAARNITPAVVVDESWLDNTSGRPEDTTPVERSDDEPCRIGLTSGTTAEPKVLVRSNRHVHLAISRFQMCFGHRFSECSRFFIDMGLATGPGFNFLIYILARGGAVFLSGGNPLKNLEAISSYRVQGMIGSPKGFAELTELVDRLGEPLSLDVVLSTGSTLTPALANRMQTRLSNNVISVYGTSETGMIVAASAVAISKIEGAVGYILPGVKIEIIDRSGKPVPNGQQGLVRICGESVLSGYAGDPELTSQRFRDGGFCPGDIGSIASNGMLVISGREGAVINLGGDKVNPERLEGILTSYESVIDAGVFELMTPLGVQVLGSAIVWRGDAALDELKRHLRTVLPVHHVPVRFITVDAVPRNASGKIDRIRLKQLAAAQINQTA